MSKPVVDSTGREIKAGQWVVQPYAQSHSVYTRIAYVIEVPDSRACITHFTLNIPGDWEDGPTQSGRIYVRRPHEASWVRAKQRYIGSTQNLTIIEAGVAFQAQEGLEEYIREVLGGDPNGVMPVVEKI